MANLDIRKNMVFWQIWLNGENITGLCNEYVNEIKVKYSITPEHVSKKRKEPKESPNEAEIHISSNNYIENLFLPGKTVEIKMGYDRVSPPTVFFGSIHKYPTGSAQELLTYVIKVIGEEATMNLVERNELYQKQHKASVIMNIATRNHWEYDIYVGDTSVIMPKFMIFQRQKTDLQFLEECAKAWNCVLWFTYPKKLHFYDAKEAYRYGEIYKLGYRTDNPTVKCNVQNVSWNHEPPRAALEINAGLFGFNEDGQTIGKHEFEWIDEYDRACVWTPNAKLQQLIKNGNVRPRQISGDITSEWQRTTIFNGLRLYFQTVTYNDNTTSDVPPFGADSGWKIKVKLNEGDPTLFPPRNAELYSGSLNPRADSAQLPAFLKEYSGVSKSTISLKINEHHLTYTNNGKLDSELICTRGMFI